MKKFILSILLILSFVFYAFYQRSKSPEDISVIIPQPTPQAEQPSPRTQQAIVTQQPPTPTPSVTRQVVSNGLKDGQFTGNVADAYYGNVQVQITISGGKIMDVQFLDYPHDRNTSVRINSQAMPILKTEVIQAQSANIDGVSGATATSQAFQQSLQSALAKAQG